MWWPGLLMSPPQSSWPAALLLFASVAISSDVSVRWLQSQTILIKLIKPDLCDIKAPTFHSLHLTSSSDSVLLADLHFQFLSRCWRWREPYTFIPILSCYPKSDLSSWIDQQGKPFALARLQRWCWCLCEPADRLKAIPRTSPRDLSAIFYVPHGFLGYWDLCSATWIQSL